MKCDASGVVFIRGQLQLPPTPSWVSPGSCTKLELWHQIPRGLPWDVDQDGSYGNPHSKKLLERNNVVGDARVSPTLSPVKATREDGLSWGDGCAMGTLLPGMWQSRPGSRKRLPGLSGATLCFHRKIDSFTAGRDEWEGCDGSSIKRRISRR